MRCSHIDMNTCSAPPQQGQQPHNNKANGESSDSVYAKKRHRARDGLSLLQRLRRHQCSSTSMPPAMQRPTVWPLIDTFVFCSHLFVVILFAKFYRRLAVPWPAELRPNLLVLDECVSAARDQHSATRDRSACGGEPRSTEKGSSAGLGFSRPAYTRREARNPLVVVESGSWPIHVLHERA